MLYTYFLVGHGEINMSLENIVERYKSWSHDIVNGVFSKENFKKCQQSIELITTQSRLGGKLFFIGNGGSHSVCLHMAEDFTKVANIPSLSLDNPCLLTCLSNDYSFEDSYKEWLRRFFTPGRDTLIAISSSGESKNIINAVKSINGPTITLTAHKRDNTLNTLGDINFYIRTSSYGCAEIYHSLLLHLILDTIVEQQ